LDSHKTLGTFKSILRNEDNHESYLQKKSNIIGERVLKAQFTRHQARLAYSSCFIPAMMYSLAATNMTKISTTKIQQKTTTTFLNFCGYDQHFARVLVYAPIIYGGL
jgi:hypothetical protein